MTVLTCSVVWFLVGVQGEPSPRPTIDWAKTPIMMSEEAFGSVSAAGTREEKSPRWITSDPLSQPWFQIGSVALLALGLAGGGWAPSLAVTAIVTAYEALRSDVSMRDLTLSTAAYLVTAPLVARLLRRPATLLGFRLLLLDSALKAVVTPTIGIPIEILLRTVYGENRHPSLAGGIVAKLFQIGETQ